MSNFLSDPIPLPPKKSTKLGAGGFMGALEELEGGFVKGGCWGAGEKWMLKSETPET